MSASTGDKITDVRNAARPNSARATGNRASGGNSLSCDNLSGWPVASKVHFVTYQIDANSNPVVGTQLDCSGIVSGNDIGSFTVIDGSDTGNSIGDVVEMLPTAAWGQDLSDALTTSLNRDGTLKDGVVTTAAKLGSNVVTTVKIADDAVTSAKVSGVDVSNLDTFSNPYKFFAYRSAAYTIPNGTYIFDTKLYDSSNAYNATTGEFTVPVSGFYVISVNTPADLPSGGVAVGNNIFKNGTNFISNLLVSTYGSLFTEGVPLATPPISLTAGDKITIQSAATGQTGRVGTAPIHTFFSAYLLSKT